MQYWERAGVEKMMEPSFEKLLVGLSKADVDFILVEGLAVSLNGYVRLTEDVDFLVSVDKHNIEKLISFLKGFGEGFGGDLSPADFTLEPGAIRIFEETEDCQMDIFTVNGGYTFDDLSDESEKVVIAGETIHFASKRQLIEIKSSSQREKDRIDIAALKQLIENPDAFD